ncbi:hypothetical protein [Klebsiella pneumoniae]|uniref:hypothetical protein n=1 Tax=Klebsiella pneumoniae TaxID=573 RepID=UPI002FF2F564
MQAPFDTVGAILSALLLGSTIMAANSLQNATSQFGSLCWMALAARHGFYLANPPHGFSLTAAEHV